MSSLFTSQFLADAWKVFALFVIPIGGGIPAGVLLAQSLHIGWPVMTLLYFISDVALAAVFEPLMMLFIAMAKRSPFLTRVGIALRLSVQKTIAVYGNKPGALALITISFGVDPMTGRSAAKAAGHGFVSGWTLAIIGDMLYFLLLMACTLSMRKVLGDGTVATLVILVVATVLPAWIKRFRERRLNALRSAV